MAGVVDLSAGSPWEFRLVDSGGPRPWRRSLPALLRSQPGAMLPLPWPISWRAFGRVATDNADIGDRDPDERQPVALLATRPDALEIGGQPAQRVDLTTDASGVIDLTRLFGPPRNGRTAWLFAEWVSEVAEDVMLHVGADWWFQLFIDGQPVFDTLATGNRWMVRDTAHRVPLHLGVGRHVIALRVRSGAGGWACASCLTTVPADIPADLHLEARRLLAASIGPFASLTLEGALEDAPLLNGQVVPVPLPGMRYAIIPGIPPRCLRRRDNRLERRWSPGETAGAIRVARLPVFTNSGADRCVAAAGRLLAIRPAGVRLDFGPILGHAGPRHASVSCRSTAPCRMRLSVAGREWLSPRSLEHRFTVRGLHPGKRYRGTMWPEGSRGGRVGVTLRTLPAGNVVLALLGDASPNPKVYAKVAGRIQAARPDAALYVGDVVHDGRSDHHWREQFWEPAPQFAAQVPLLFTPGNHDEDAPLWDRLFCHPPGGRRWSVRIGAARMIGIDGLDDWSAASANAQWLDEELTRAREPFIFLADHYPAWTSTAHGALGTDGRPLQRPVRESRDVILPLLQRHQATAMINGHAHCYERSVMPDGFTLITTGGAGGFLYQPMSGLNPNSRVFAMAHHWCRLDLSPDGACLTAFDLRGTVLDRCDFPPLRRRGAGNASARLPRTPAKRR